MFAPEVITGADACVPATPACQRGSAPVQQRAPSCAVTEIFVVRVQPRTDDGQGNGTETLHPAETRIPAGAFGRISPRAPWFVSCAELAKTGPPVLKHSAPNRIGAVAE
jgi:hypothetical protein